MPNAVAEVGQHQRAEVVDAQRLPSTLSPNHLTIRNTGIIVTWNGTISVAINVTKSAAAAEEPDAGERVAGQAAARTRLLTSTTSVTNALLRKKCPNGADAHASE